jgi:hypothetical protein
VAAVGRLEQKEERDSKKGETIHKTIPEKYRNTERTK